MKPITRKLLPDTVTLVNESRNPETGLAVRFRTCLRFTRVAAGSVSLASSKDMGETRTIRAELWIDPIASLAHEPGSGGRDRKPHAEPHVWDVLADKGKFWTLREGDAVFKGEWTEDPPPEGVAEGSGPPRYTVRTVTEVRDGRGTIHHWEVELV